MPEMGTKEAQIGKYLDTKRENLRRCLAKSSRKHWELYMIPISYKSNDKVTMITVKTAVKLTTESAAAFARYGCRFQYCRDRCNCERNQNAQPRKTQD